MTTLRLTLNQTGFRLTTTALAGALHLSLVTAASAAELDTGSADLKIRWDNTVKYNIGTRLKEQSAALLADLNGDDGNRNFNKGSLITNRLDVLSEFDLSYKKIAGVRVSASGWYDQVYNKSTDNTFATAKNSAAAIDRFPSETRKLHGRNVEALDAFVFWNTEVASSPLTLRLGRHTVLYGETIFFGANGIANAQGPVDVIKALAVPGSQVKEIVMPVNQLSANLQLNSEISLGGYYQLEFRKTRVPGSGSFFDDASFLGDGGRFLYAGPLTLDRLPDQEAKDSGQFGLQLKWRPASVDAEFGFYAARYHDKTPQSYVRLGFTGFPAPAPAVLPAGYQFVYHEGIRTYGASVNKGIGDFNVGVEASIRDNAPLVNDGPAGFPGTDYLHPIGRTAHLNVSTVVLLPQTALWGGGSFLAEIAWNRRLKVTKNESALAANASREGLAMRAVLEPSYYQVIPALDLSVPIGLGYNFQGASSSVPRMNGTFARKGGDFSLGLKGIYNNDIRFALTYTHFLGDEGKALNSANQLQFKNTLSDRDNVTFTVQKTF